MTVTENKINHIVAITNGSDIYFPKKLIEILNGMKKVVRAGEE